MSKQKPETAVAVVERSRTTALIGTIEDRIRAFEQIAANLAGLQLNGWNTAQKAKAACWLADGAGMHPATFMQNHYCMEIKGKLLVEPKMEFILGMLQSRLPGFKFKVLVETDDCAKVWMSDGRGNERTVEYTIQDAKRQGLLGRDGNMWTAGNTREGCLKQATKRAGRWIGAAVLMDLPVGLDGSELEALPDGRTTEKEPSVAEVVDEAIKVAVGEGAAPSGPEPQAGVHSADATVEQERLSSGAAAPAPTAEPGPRARLSALILRYYGKLSKSLVIEKVSLLYNAMVKEETGNDPQVSFRKADDVGPVDAERIAVYLERQIAKSAGNGPEEGESTEGQGAPPADDDEPPAPEVAQPPAKERTSSDAFTDLMSTVKRARGLFSSPEYPREFVKEAPPGTGKLWFVDQATFQQAGDESSVKLKVGPDVVAEASKIDQLNAILTKSCDEKERGR